ncbi:hypothetical protein A2U01_0091569 [Trifolium medium]|uniref:Uncharacterized protein n=1 Tax=Trifolium medium TaxID=97028 RepID=A0A392UD11_9FABA|nr:hypothetical protein [Trifolium medium]
MRAKSCSCALRSFMPRVAQLHAARCAALRRALRSFGRALRLSGQGLLALARCAALWRAFRRGQQT